MNTDLLRTGHLVDVGQDGLPAIRFERRLATAPDRVWRAVTDPVEMRSWFPCAVEGERRVGAVLRFPSDEHAVEIDEGVVTAWDPPRSWSFVWGGFPVTIAVEADGEGSLLRFTQGLPSDRSPGARQAAGWHVCLDRLHSHLDGEEGPAPEAWRERYESYLRTTPAVMGVVGSSTTIRWVRSHFAPADKVWRCLTDGDAVSAWWGAPVTFDLRLGGLVHFDFRPAAAPFDGVIVAFEEGRRVAYTFGGVSVVEWTVAPATLGAGTDFTLTHHDMESSVEGSAFDVAGTAAGWHGLLHQLDLYVAAGMAVLGADDEAARREEYAAILAAAGR